jgi:tetratricopeptide (TPR) repeat protein
VARTPTREDLEQARAEAEKAAAERPRARLLEPLARTHRWLGDEAEAARLFRAAAEDARAVVERYPEREDSSRIALVGSLLWRAGDVAAARSWLERALRGTQGLGDAAGLHYLLGDFGRAAALAREASEDPDDRPYPWAEAVEVLAVARRDGDGDRAERAWQTFADLIRIDGTPLWEESGSLLSLHDWYAEAARAEAELFDGSAPGYDELLERLRR